MQEYILVLGLSSNDIMELLMVLGAVAMVVFFIGASALAARTIGKFFLCVPVAALVVAIYTMAALRWDELEFVALFFLEMLVAGAVAATWFSQRKDVHRPLRVFVGVFLALFIIPHLLMLLDRTGIMRGIARERGAWMIVVPMCIPVAIAVVQGLMKLCGVLLECCVRTTHSPGADTAGGPAPQQRQAIMEMLRESKITGKETGELLKALESAPPGDTLPLEPGALAAVIGGVIIAVGFVLPWAFIRIDMPMIAHKVQGFQAGYHVGAIAWVILGIGLLPSLLACVPALDRGVRQGLLRLILSAMGLALAGALCLTHLANLGIWVIVAGFALQFVSALGQAGLLQTARSVE